MSPYIHLPRTFDPIYWLVQVEVWSNSKVHVGFYWVTSHCILDEQSDVLSPEIDK